MKIVAIIDLMTAEQDQKLIDYVSSLGAGYWHWIDGAWLISTPTGDSSLPEKIRDKVKEIAPEKHSFVFEVKGTGNWAGFGPNTEEKSMFKWIRNEWEK